MIAVLLHFGYRVLEAEQVQNAGIPEIKSPVQAMRFPAFDKIRHCSAG
jgi:hypothetical protein